MDEVHRTAGCVGQECRKVVWQQAEYGNPYVFPGDKSGKILVSVILHNLHIQLCRLCGPV